MPPKELPKPPPPEKNNKSLERKLPARPPGIDGNLFTQFGNNTLLRNTDNISQTTFQAFQSNRELPLPPTPNPGEGGIGRSSGNIQKEITQVYRKVESTVNLSEKELPAAPQDNSGGLGGEQTELTGTQLVIEKAFAPFKDKLTTFDEKASQSDLQSFLKSFYSPSSEQMQNSNSDVQQPSPNQEIPVPESAHQLREQVAKWVAEQGENQARLADAQKTFNEKAKEIETLANWNVKGHITGRFMRWHWKHSGQPTERNPEHIYREISIARWTKHYIEDHMKDLREMRNFIEGKMKKIPRINSTIEDYPKVTSKIESMDDHGVKGRLEQYIHRHDTTLKQNRVDRIDVMNRAESQLEEINTAMEKTQSELLNSSVKLWHLEGENAPHPFFLEAEMSDAQPKSEVIREELARDGVVDVFRTLFKARGIEVPDEKFLAQTLGDFPQGGTLDREQLRTNLPRFGRQEQKLQFEKIASGELVIALDKGPIGAIFNNAPRLENVPVPKNYQHEGPVILDDLKWNHATAQLEVTVVDQWRENSYQVGLDALQKVWNGDTILPSSAYQEIQQTRNLDGLQRQLAEGLEKQQANQRTYAAAQEKFNTRAQEINNLAVWNAQDLTIDQVMNWASQYPGLPQSAEGTDGRIAALERTERYLATYRAGLDQMKDNIRGEIDNLPPIQAIEDNNYKGIQSELNKLGYTVATDHVRESLRVYDSAYHKNLQTFIAVNREAQSQRENIDVAMGHIRKRWGEVMVELERLQSEASSSSSQKSKFSIFRRNKGKK